MNSLKTLLLLVLLNAGLSLAGQTVRVMTYNIRYDNPADGKNAWSLRREWLCDQVRKSGPGLLGIQEGLFRQVTWLDSALSGFDYIGVGRDDGAKEGEYSAIFYDTRLYRVIRQSTFWLSPTPDKPTMGWDAACIRICTCGLFEEIKTGRKFWMFNTHFDHIGEVARKNSAVLILSKIAEINREHYPVILTGDFNGGPSSVPISVLSDKLYDTYFNNGTSEGDTIGTFNGFGNDLPARERIDYIFTGPGDFTIAGYRIIREYHDGLFPSDHFPVVAELKLKALKNR